MRKGWHENPLRRKLQRMGHLYRRKKKHKNGDIVELPTWWLSYHAHGRNVRESSGTDKETVARRMLRVREGDVERGVPITKDSGRLLFDAAGKAVLTDYETNGRTTLKDATHRMNTYLMPVFKGRRLSGITNKDIRAFIARRLEAKASPAEVNRELALLKRTFSLALKNGQLFAKPYIPLLEERNVRRGFFEREDFEAVRDLLPLPLQPVVTFAYLTGWRLTSEVLPMEWHQVDFEGRTVRLDPGTTKNREGRTFPFTSALEAVLRAQWTARNGAFVFHREGAQIKSLREAWRTACELAGVDRIPHDFRRTAVRNLERSGVPRSAAMAMVGHKTESIYRRYAIVDAATLREAAAKIDASKS